ncbi:MAG: hypothetical protein ABIG28_00165 [archaeon]
MERDEQSHLKLLTSKTEGEEKYAERYNDHRVRLVWHSSEPIDSKKEVVEVRLTTKDGTERSSNYVTRKFLDWVFKKNRKTGECAQGSYFAMPGMVVVDEINETTTKEIIKEMIKNREVEKYFLPLD